MKSKFIVNKRAMETYRKPKVATAVLSPVVGLQVLLAGVAVYLLIVTSL